MIEIDESKFGFCCCYPDCTAWLLSNESEDYEIFMQQLILMAEYIHINRPGPAKSKPIRKRNRIKWCFYCRKHLPHMLTMTYEIEPSYYDPRVWLKCSGCGEDYTQFWGSF